MENATLSLAIEFIKLIFYVATVAIGSGWIVTALTQLLKWKAIKIPAQKYPTVIAVILSALLAIPAVFLTGLIEVAGWWSYAVIAVASLFVSVESYDTVKNAILQLKATDEKK